MGQERRERFLEIARDAERDLPDIISKYLGSISGDKILLAALSGSSVYGPRRPGQRLSDVDIGFLLDSDNPSLNFEVKHEQTMADFGTPYGIVGTGYTDKARGNLDIHWLIFPHYPLRNSVDDKRLKMIIAGITTDTALRRDELETEIIELDMAIAARRGEQILD